VIATSRAEVNGRGIDAVTVLVTVSTTVTVEGRL
jgi:hypothetical protein